MTRPTRITVTDYRALAETLAETRLRNGLGRRAAAAIERLSDAYLHLLEKRQAEDKIIAAARKLCSANANEATAAYRQLELAVAARDQGLN
jgi:hypothetical protein